MRNLVVVLCTVFCTAAFAQPQPQTMARIRDATDPNAVTTVARPNAAAVNPAGVYAVDAMGFEMCFDSANWVRSQCGTMNTDGIAVTNRGKYSSAFMHVYDTVANAWDRASSHAYGDALSTTQAGMDSLCYNLFYDSTVGSTVTRRWYGAALDSDGLIGNRLYAPYVGAFGYGWDATNSHWDRLRTDANGALTVNQTTGFPGYGRIQDGDSTVLADVEDTIADGKATTLNGVITLAMTYLYNGASMDMARAGAVGEMQVTDVATRPGEDGANDFRKTKKQEIATWTEAKETSGNIAAAAVVVLASKQVISWPNCCIYYRNKDAAQVLTDAAVYVSPDNSGTCGDANWVSLTWTTCDALGAGATCVYCFTTQAYRYVCGTATAAAPAADVDSVETWITCNKG